MRVCVVIPAHWDAIMGGSQYQAKMLVEHLIKDGHEVFYLARTVASDVDYDDYEVISVKGALKSRVGDSLQLFRRLKAIKPDVIYQRVACAYTAVCALYARRYNVKMVWHLASDMDVGLDVPKSLNPFNILEGVMISYGRRLATEIVAQTNSQARALYNVCGRNPTNVIPNFQPLPNVAPDRKSEKTTILWVGNLKPIKRPEILVALAKDLATSTSLSFFMIGRPYPDPAKQKNFEDLVKTTDNLVYLGPKSIDDVNTLLLSADLLVNTSSVEGFSNTFIQAWMRKVPVLSLSVNPDGILSDFDLGRCANGDLSLLKTYILDLAKDKVSRMRLADRVYAHAKERHSMSNISDLAKVLFD